MNTKSTLSFYTTQNYIDTDFFVNTITRENGNNTLVTKNLSIYDIEELAFNLNYKLDIDDKGHSIEFEINHSKSKSPQSDFMTETIIGEVKHYDRTSKTSIVQEKV